VVVSRSLAGEVEHKFASFHDITAVDIDGTEVSMSKFKGKTLLICNVACK
jgi:glutathione peroxidase-family protein